MGACSSIQKNAKNPSQQVQTSQADIEILESSNLKKFRLAVLQAATKNFHQDFRVSASGRTFKGWVDKQSLTASNPESGMLIAVKQFHNPEEFFTGVKYLAPLDHPSLAKLLGYCLDDNHALLVFEFMAHGSLLDHLIKRNSSFQPLSWNNRVKIALDAAKGLAFLHSGEVNVIFRDFKSSSILLDADYNAKLYEFGLARNGPTTEEGHVSTRVMGTLGYTAPEYLATGHLTTKCDVYAFGVVLLEILTSHRIIDVLLSGEETSLVDWATSIMRSESKLLTIMDDEIEGQYSISDAKKFGNLALQCSSTDPKLRPSMPQVVATLEQLKTESNASASSTSGNSD
ncbi:unnamed protein product [Rhodiola kirilowii]